MRISNEEIEASYHHKAPDGLTRKQDKNSYEVIEGAMREGLKKGRIWWFAYELPGWHELPEGRYFVSYEISSRISEMCDKGILISRPSDGKLYLYRLAEINKDNPPPSPRPQAEVEKCEHGLPTFVLCPNCNP